MAKVVYNTCYGGFGLSDKAIQRYSDIKGLDFPDGESLLYGDDIDRHDHALVQIVEEMGKESWGEHARLFIREVPDGARYRIEEYDGLEWVILESEVQWETAE